MGRDLRALIAHRRRLVSQQTQCKNRLQSVLHRNHIVPPQGKLYHPDNRAWWLVVPVLILVAFNAFIPLMTVVNYAFQETFGDNVFFWEGTRWFEGWTLTEIRIISGVICSQPSDCCEAPITSRLEGVVHTEPFEAWWTELHAP